VRWNEEERPLLSRLRDALGLGASKSLLPVAIRSAAEADCAKLAEFAVALALANGFLLSRTLAQESIAGQLFAPQSSISALIAENASGEAVGYAAFQDAFRTSYGERYRYLTELFVVPHARRRGVARALLSAVAQTTPAVLYVRWETPHDNMLAPAVYRRLGARPHKVRSYVFVAGTGDQPAQ
jgi:ribosomal protein S18 acetylase RimI-like enzyme